METPVIILLFNRPLETNTLFEHLEKVKPKKIYINQDGPRDNNKEDILLCNEVEKIFSKPKWNCEIFINQNKNNKGCRESVSKGLNWFFEKEEKGIILEDDCIPAKSFFNFSEKMLEKYKNEKKIYTISGSNFQNNQIIGKADYYFSKYAHCWGWSTWRDAWKKYDTNMTFWNEWKQSSHWKNLHNNQLEQKYWQKIFDLVSKKKIDSWAYVWLASIWYKNGINIIPNKNLIVNIGFNKNATHTNINQNKHKKSTFSEFESKITDPIEIVISKEADKFVFKNHFKGKYNFYPWKLILYFKYFINDPIGFFNKVKKDILKRND
tara:strand:- start:14130 stop:15095 length:966 start_codon:yes stop_codon:yes gene_type:complete